MSGLRCSLCEMYVPHENHDIIGVQADDETDNDEKPPL